MVREKTIQWLKVASASFILFGLGVALAAHPATALPMTLFTDLALWPFDGLQNLNTPEARILSGVCGGILAGWGVMFWMLAAHGLRAAPLLTRKIMLASVTTWFVIDSTASIAAGAPFNAILNVPFLLAIVLPLWRPTSTVVA